MGHPHHNRHPLHYQDDHHAVDIVIHSIASSTGCHDNDDDAQLPRLIGRQGEPHWGKEIGGSDSLLCVTVFALTYFFYTAASVWYFTSQSTSSSSLSPTCSAYLIVFIVWTTFTIFLCLLSVHLATSWLSVILFPIKTMASATSSSGLAGSNFDITRWVILTATWFLSAGLKWAQEAISRFFVFYFSTVKCSLT